MPSPFPGMDPYLEGELWTSVHTQLGVEIARQLVPRLRPRYVAISEKRFILAMPDLPDDVAVSTADDQTSVYPDAAIAQATPAPHLPPAQGGAAAAAPLQLATVMPEAVPHVSVEIRDAANRRLVTAIELLSPTNKKPGEGRDEYLEKRRRLLLSTAHLVEIDLLRGGARVPMRRPLPSVPYFVLVSRAERRPMTDVYPVRLEGPLPEVSLPLLAGDADVPLDLQQALTNVYDLGGYDLLVDYTRPPEPPLNPAEAQWARERLAAAGLAEPGT